jgi:hypothetical protein
LSQRTQADAKDASFVCRTQTYGGAFGKRLSSVLCIALLSACTRKEQADLAPSADAAVEATAPVAVPSAPPTAPPSAAAPVEPRVVEPAPDVAALAWKTHRGDKFTVLFPGEPKLSILPAEEDRAAYHEAKLDLPGGQVSFAAGYSDLAASEITTPDKFLDDHVNAPRRGLTDVLHKRTVTLAGHPGRVLILRRNISGTPLRIYSRLYLVGRRVYSLIVSTLDTGGVSEDVVKRFFESFKLT